jgi:DNA modification methylase
MELILGDCLEKLKELEDNSVDAIVTDPPYGLSFMGKKWDYDVPSKEVWKECLRVLKPCGYLLSFAGTRTQHRMAVNIEDAGFEIRDMIVWVYGSGFPKSLNIGKAVDKLQGNEREYIGENPNAIGRKENVGKFQPVENISGGEPRKSELTKGTSEWEGWGTALKPALEPITVARKPLEKGLNVAQNCLKWGVGGINIDGCRVEHNEPEVYTNRTAPKSNGEKMGIFTENGKLASPSQSGRFPANLIHDGSEEVRECFPETKSGTLKPYKQAVSNANVDYAVVGEFRDVNREGDSGSAARFFYCAKASKRERNMGLDCYLTVKYNIPLCKEENMAVAQLLRRVISDTEVMSLSIDESGENIMVQCHKDSLFIILTEINKIIESKTLPLLMHSLTNESTQDVSLEKENGGSHAENVESLKRFLLATTKENLESALGVSRVVLEMLLTIRERENWKEATNFHSTVKPLALMEYLVKMVSREGQVVLDPFMGSGTTGMACKKLNRDFIGIEMMPEYMEIAKCRIEAWEVDEQLELSKLTT